MYLSRYKLKKSPFLLTPDPDFLHFGESHRQAFRALLEGILSRKGFMVLTGQVGTGKTTLINALLGSLHRVEIDAPGRIPKVLTGLLVNPLLTRSELLEAVLDEFDIDCPHSTKPRRLLALQEKLLELQKVGGTAVLIIDEAHLLTVELLEEIRVLANIDMFRGKLFQVIFCGQPEFASVLLRPELKALRQRIAVLTELRPLNMAESNAYIEKRLRQAGLCGPSPFSTHSLEEIYRCTKGIPRLINLLCDKALLLACEQQIMQIGPEVVQNAVKKLSIQSIPAPGLESVRRVVDPSPTYRSQTEPGVPLVAQKIAAGRAE